MEEVSRLRHLKKDRVDSAADTPSQEIKEAFADGLAWRNASPHAKLAMEAVSQDGATVNREIKNLILALRMFPPN